jgi:hypothetical protein
LESLEKRVVGLLKKTGSEENDILLLLEPSALSFIDSAMPSRIEGEIPPAIRRMSKHGGFTMDELEEERRKLQPSVVNNLSFGDHNQIGVINLGPVQGSIKATVQTIASQGGGNAWCDDGRDLEQRHAAAKWLEFAVRDFG